MLRSEGHGIHSAYPLRCGRKDNSFPQAQRGGRIDRYSLIARHPEGPLYRKSFGVSGLGFDCLFFPVLWGRIGFEGKKKLRRDASNRVDGSLESLFVRPGWFIEACDLSSELERSSSHLVRGDGWIEVEKGFDISAHLRRTSMLDRGAADDCLHFTQMRPGAVISSMGNGCNCQKSAPDGPAQLFEYPGCIALS